MRKLFIIILTALSLYGYGQGINVLRTTHHPITEAAASSYIDEYQAVLDAMTTDPTGDTLTWQNALVDSLVTNGYWARMDWLHIYANPENGDDESLINWIDPGTFDGTEVNSPVWTRLEGYAGLRTSNRVISTGYTPSTDAINVSATSITVGLYVRTDISGGFSYDIGSDGTGTADIFMRVFDASDNFNVQINNASGMTASNTTSEGFYFATRRTSGNMGELYKNGTGVNGPTAIFTPTLSDATVYVLGRTTSSASDHQVAIAFMMDEVTDAEVTDINNFFETYMDAIGTGVQ